MFLIFSFQCLFVFSFQGNLNNVGIFVKIDIQFQSGEFPLKIGRTGMRDDDVDNFRCREW